MRRGLAAQRTPLGRMFWTEKETGPLMHGASLSGEKSFSLWVDRFVSNLDRSFMHKQGCVVCVHVTVRGFFLTGFWVFGVSRIHENTWKRQFLKGKRTILKEKNQNIYRSHVKSDDDSFPLAFQRHVVISFNHFNHCVG